MDNEVNMDNDRKDGGPAFPQGQSVGQIAVVEGGASLRDLFACHALDRAPRGRSSPGSAGPGTEQPTVSAGRAWTLADAMLAER